MPNLKDFLEAMSASWPVALAILMGSSAVLVGERVELSYLTTLPDFIFGIAFLLAAFSASVLAVTFIRSVVAQFDALRVHQRRKQQIEKHVSGLADLPNPERDVLTYVAACRTQVFLAPQAHVRLEPLVAKGYVQILPGTHSILEWPHKVPDHIWAELIRLVEPADPTSLSNPFSRGGW